MHEQMSRDAWERLPSQKERDEFIRSGGTLYDGKTPPVVQTSAKPDYWISRKLYDSLSVGQERNLIENYTVRIVD
jgi:hypothetical protein